MKKTAYSLPYGLVLCLILLFVQNAPLRADIYIDATPLPQTASLQQLGSALERVYQKSLDNGIRNFIPYALFLIKRSEEAVKQGDYDKAVLLSDYARKLSPELPPVYILQSRLAWHKNKILLYRLLPGYLHAFLKKIYNLEDFAFALFVNLSVLTGAFLLTLCLFGLLCMAKYCKLIFHDVRHVVTQAIPDNALRAVIPILCVLPLLFGFTIFWMFVFWIVLLFSYCTKKEQITAMILLALYSCLPLVMSVLCFCLYLPQFDMLDRIWRVNYGCWNQQDIEQLEHYLKDNPDDQEILFSLGLVHKKEKNYRTAQRYYEKLLAVNPDQYKAQVNKGNVYLATAEWQQAVDAYQHAIVLAPASSHAAHFNLARAYQQKFMFKEAEQELIAAKRINASTVDNYLKIYSEDYNRLIIDETISRKNVWKKGYHFFTQQEELIHKMWDRFFRGIPLLYAMPVTMGLFFFSFFAVRKDKFRISIQCRICARALCRRCQGSLTEDNVCAQCQNFFQRQTRIDFLSRQEKIAQITWHLRIYTVAAALLSLLFPGAGHIWKEQPIKGVICLLVSFCLMLKPIAIAVIEDPWGIAGLSAVPDMVLCLSALLGWWFFVILDVRRIKGKEATLRLFLK